MVVSRLSGGEFGVVLNNISFDDSIKIMAQIRSKVASLVVASEISPTISVGVCSFDTSLKFDQAIIKGYMALQKAKINGKNRVEIL